MYFYYDYCCVAAYDLLLLMRWRWLGGSLTVYSATAIQFPAIGILFRELAAKAQCDINATFTNLKFGGANMKVTVGFCKCEPELARALERRTRGALSTVR